MPSRHSSVFAGLGTAEIVEAGAGMGVDHAERRGLFAQVQQHAAEHGVLDDVGEVAGVIGVTVVHRARCYSSMILSETACRPA